MNIFTKYQLIFYLSFAVLIRLIIAPFFFHPDIKTYSFQVSFLNSGVINIYNYLEVNKSQLPLKEEFIYFPLTYFFLGGYQILITPLLGDNFPSWLFNAAQNVNFETNVFRYLFLLKLPYLLIDLLIGLVLVKLVNTEVLKRRVFLLWLFNPISICLIYIYSNIDVFPVLFSLLSLLMLRKNHYLMAGVMLGIGVGFKAYPLLFLPFLILTIKSKTDRLKVLVGSVGTILVITLPFISSSSFRESTLTSGLMTRLLNNSISLGFGESLILGVVALVGLFFYAWSKEMEKDDLWRYALAVLLIIFSFVHYHIQWILWITPFLVLMYTQKFKSLKAVPILMLVLLFIPLLYSDKFMTFGLLQPISELLLLLPSPFGILQKIYDPYVVQSLLHSIFLAGSSLVIYDLLAKKDITQ